MKTQSNIIQWIALLLVVFGLTSSLSAQLALSTFDTDADGWLVSERISGTFQFVGTRQPTYQSTGGNPAGHIRTSDGSETWMWRAPSKFLGDQSRAYGGRIEFDIFSDLQVTPITYGLLILSGGGTTNYAPITTPTTTSWTHRSIEIRAGGPWTNLATGLPATEAQMRTALASVAMFDIQGEWATGADTGGIDNVALYAGCPQSTIRVSEVEVCWLSALNVQYRVDYRLSLPTDPWLPLFSGVVGTGEEMCVTDRVARGQPQRFYRVVCEDEVVTP